MKSVLLIGGGIVGQFSAYYLSKAGHKVTIVDENPSMPPASAGNCGLITPSHIAPLNSWGTLIQGIKWLGKKNAPLYIRPQLDPSFINWFISFIWHSKKASVKRATEVRHELLQLSWKLYSEFFANESNKAEWSPKGLVYAYKTEQGKKELEHEVSLLQSFGLKSELLSKKELLDLEPMLNDEMIGGAIHHIDGWLNPSQLMLDIKAINETNGVKTVTEKILGFNHADQAIKSTNTNDDALSADEFVLCGGARSVMLAKQLGISLPIIPGKGYNLSSSVSLKNQPQRPIYMVEKKVVATPWSSGFRLGSTMEFTGYDLSLNQARLEALKAASNEYLKTEVTNADFVPWAGWRPMTSDSIPIIRRAENYKNLTLATGHGMLGLSMAPATGHLVSEIISKNA